MFNNYEKMKEMESVITSALPAASPKGGPKSGPKSGQAGTSGTQPYQDSLEEEELLVEEAQGQVFPTIGTETMSPTYPAESLGGVESKAPVEPASTEAPGQEEAPSQETSPAVSTAQTEPAASASAPTTYRVQDGETLYSICLKFYHNLNRIDEICQLNNLESQDKIISGQNLILP